MFPDTSLDRPVSISREMTPSRKAVDLQWFMWYFAVVKFFNGEKNVFTDAILTHGSLPDRRRGAVLFCCSCFVVMFASVLFFCPHKAYSQVPASKSASKLSLTSEETQWLKDHNVWRLGIDPAWPPVEMLDAERGYTGMLADYISLITGKLAVTASILKDMTWSEMLGKAEQGHVDVVTSMVYTYDRSAYMNFSDVTIDLPVIIVGRVGKKGVENVSDLAGKVVAVTSGYAVQEWLVKDCPGIIIYPCRNTAYALDAVVFGQADAYVGDLASASYFIDRFSITSLRVMGRTKYSFPLRIGVRKDWPELIPILNKTLASISQEQRDAIRKKWIKFEYKPDRLSQIYHLVPYLLIFLLIIFGGANWILQKQVRRRKRAENTLRDAKNYLDKIINTIPDPVFVKDRRYSFVLVNDALCSFLGRSREDLIGKSDADFFPDDQVAVFKEKDEEIFNTGRENLNEEFITDSLGNVRNILTKKALYRDNSGNEYIVGVIRDITEIQHVEEQMRQWMHRYDLIIAASGQVAYEYKISDGSIVWGHTVKNVLGYSFEEMNGGLEQWVSLLHPDDRQGVVSFLDKTRESCSYWDVEYRFKHRKGDYIWIRDRGFFTADNTGKAERQLGMMEDVTASKRIKQEQERLASILEVTPDFVGFAAPGENLLYLNKAVRAYCGIGAGEDVTRLKLRDVHPEWAYKIVKEEILPSAAKNGLWRGECAFLSRDGKEIPVSMVVLAHKDDSGRVDVFSSVSRDISELKKIQESQRLTQLGQLVSTMAHEVNNPIMIISGNAQLALMDENLSPDARKYLKIIYQECQNTRDIIQRLLKFSRPSKGVMVESDINKVIESVAQIVAHQFELAGIRIETDFGPDLPLVKLDVQQINEVFLNLLNNSRDAMADGGVISIKTAFEDGKVRIDIKDTGSGIPAEVLEKIFEPFFTTKEKGTGLGLSICSTIIKGQNGELTVKSKHGEGTVFTIFLPPSA